MLKGISIVVLVLAVIGVVSATVLITDEGVWVNNNKVIVEQNYTSWIHKWTNNITDNLDTADYCSFHIDDENGILSVSWRDSASKSRFGRYDITDFSTICQSSAGSNYMVYPHLGEVRNFNYGNAFFDYGGISNSVQTYILLGRSDTQNIEVWSGSGASALWSHNVSDDIGADCYTWSGSISSTGKWIIIEARSGVFGSYVYKLVCYEGS